MTTNDALVAAFDKFKASVDAGYENVRQCLCDGDYQQAEELLARIAQLHARTSVSMRAHLTKRGLLPGDDG